MKYAYIEWSNIRTNHLQNPTTKNHFSKHSERSFQKSLRFPWEQRHSSPTYKRGDFPDGGFAVPIRSIASNSEFLYNAFESIRLPMLGALLASGKKKNTLAIKKLGLLNFRCEEVERSKKFLGLDKHGKNQILFQATCFKVFQNFHSPCFDTYLNISQLLPHHLPIHPKTWNTWFPSSYKIPFKFPPLLPF